LQTEAGAKIERRPTIEEKEVPEARLLKQRYQIARGIGEEDDAFWPIGKPDAFDHGCPETLGNFNSGKRSARPFPAPHITLLERALTGISKVKSAPLKLSKGRLFVCERIGLKSRAVHQFLE
jgi:hypothetical protein